MSNIIIICYYFMYKDDSLYSLSFTLMKKWMEDSINLTQKKPLLLEKEAWLIVYMKIITQRTAAKTKR